MSGEKHDPSLEESKKSFEVELTKSRNEIHEKGSKEFRDKYGFPPDVSYEACVVAAARQSGISDPDELERIRQEAIKEYESLGLHRDTYPDEISDAKLWARDIEEYKRLGVSFQVDRYGAPHGVSSEEYERAKTRDYDDNYDRNARKEERDRTATNMFDTFIHAITGEPWEGPKI